MKRFLPLLLTLASLVGLMGCGSGTMHDPAYIDPVETTRVPVVKGTNILHSVRHGACSYVVYEAYHGGGIVHAGDCTNPIHQPDTTSHR